MQAQLFETLVVDTKRNGSPCFHDVGCENCPLNKSGKRKVINIKDIKGRPIAVWSDTPGETESRKGQNLVGPAGRLFWRDAKKAGFTRKDCDIQSVVRCRPTKRSASGYLINRVPKPEELYHCSKYNYKALEKLDAKVFLILGSVAAEQLLGKEYKKKGKSFWSDEFNAHVIVTTHPSQFLRDRDKAKRKEYIAALKLAAQMSGYVEKGKVSFLKQQDYKALFSVAAIKEEMRLVEDFCTRTKERLSVDIEHGVVNGKQVILCIGYCYKPGRSRIVYLDHPERPHLAKDERQAIIEAQRRILENRKIKKTLHFGTSDDYGTQELIGVRIRGFDYDTNYAEYLRFSGKGAYGLAAIAEARFLPFAGYKGLAAPYFKNYAEMPIKVMTLYNGADCDLGKRIEVTTRKKVNLALTKAYTYASFPVSEMQRHGPVFDYEHYTKVDKIVPVQLSALIEKLKLLARDPDFNPASPTQVKKVMYEKLGIPKLKKRSNYRLDGGNAEDEEEEGTGAEILAVLGRKHEFPRLLAIFRVLAKMNSTYLKSFKESADLHRGLLATIWWLTGTITGRMRSGGGSTKRKGDGIVNLQNIHGDPLIENLLVSDKNWRVVTDIIKGQDRERINKLFDQIDQLTDKDKDKKDAYEKLIKGILHKCIEEAFESKKFRRALKKLKVLFGVDWSQLEIRILAHMAKDKEYLKVFEDPKNDPHSVVGAALTGLAVELIKKDRIIRTMIKAIHFAMVYGKKAPAIREQLEAEGVKKTLKEVEAFVETYFTKYEGVKNEIERLIEFAKQTGYTETIFGFKREVGNQNGRTTFWENQAVNSPVQGGAHQLMVIVLAILHIKKKVYTMFQDLRMEVHDALYSHVGLFDLPEALKQSKQLMEKEVLTYVEKWFGFKLRVPLIAEAKAGFRLGTIVSYEGEPVKEFLLKWLYNNEKVERSIAASVKKFTFA